jgi:hypothetical protein
MRAFCAGAGLGGDLLSGCYELIVSTTVAVR